MFPDIMSFSSPCGVEKITRALRNCAALFSGGTSPVNSASCSSGSSKCFLNVCRCCSASGLVGASIIILLCG